MGASWFDTLENSMMIAVLMLNNEDGIATRKSEINRPN
jgi:hypothetical protein